MFDFKNCVINSCQYTFNLTLFAAALVYR